MIKAVLVLERGFIPPTLHFERPNPEVDWDRYPLEVPTALREWKDERRFVGVSGFGASGTNAHVILGAAPPIEQATETTPPRSYLRGGGP